ncbi:D-methionine transport system permease protein [Gracilibacillus halotolerans]|uniref:D-methionine transport system permease protein n=2 Tax=Gracilibacillus halotolerans TaxID=74386 RepID=A0A841RRD2_9BACI|nr:D-methionine transport system permease protein [Gracilibacillus halotolerans]
MSMWDRISPILPEMQLALWQTFYMVAVSVTIGVILGTLVGTLLYITRPGSLLKMPATNAVLNVFVNIFRSIPFLLLTIAIIPFTRLIVGTAIGTTAAIVPMTISCIPYFARLIESTLLEVNRGVIEAAESMGANRFQLVWKILYSEARAGFANNITILTVSFISYSTIVGIVGGGGIGDFAIRYGYNRYDTEIMMITIVLIIVIVQVIQSVGNLIVKRLDKRI